MRSPPATATASTDATNATISRGLNIPASIDTSLNPIASWPHDGGARASIDLDNFGSGFALWSGTSFAAPVLAGDLAAALLERFDGGDTSKDPKAALDRFTAVLADLDDGVPP